MFRSLTFKWVATLLVTSLIGVVLVGLFAYRTTVNEFDRLRIEQAQATFISEATTYYQEHQSWAGFEEWLHAQADETSGYGEGVQLCALADAAGNVVVNAGPFDIGDVVRTTELERGFPIAINNVQVGTVLLAAPPPGPDPREQKYLDRTTLALGVGALGAGAVALLVGLLLSRNFLRPLGELTHAITAMKRGELNQQVTVRTRDELGALAQTFNQMSAEIHRANQLRKQMTADIAHDLRTPLMVISGYLEALRDGTLKPTQARFDAMNQEVLLLKRLIDDLRTLSLADAGELKLVYQPVPPRDLLEQVQQSFAPLAEEQQVSLRVEADDAVPLLNIDRERMVQVLANLVSNALRYTPAGGTVTLGARRQADRVQLMVNDTGSGIPEDKLPNVFERFYRIEESRTENQGESGLGLAIARSIVEAHRGTITATSTLGSGTSMIITLQLQMTGSN
ncbi:MAG: ATP-binding protein [Anaerolineae bacterium]